MPRKRPTMTKSEIQRIRANLSRKATQIGNRLSDYALGVEGIQMSSAQVRAGLGVLQNVLPSMQSMELNDISENRQSYVDVEAAYQAALQSLEPGDIKALLQSLPPEERELLLESLDEQQH